MFKYGSFIGGEDNNIYKLSIYNFFIYYFDNPLMKRFGKDTNGFVLYGCRIPTQLSINSKYIIAAIEASKAPREDEVTLDKIDWNSLQTRILDEKHSVPSQLYREKSDEISLSQIKVFEKSDKIYKYSCERLQGLTIALLFSKSQTRVFADIGTVKMAIENYNTVLMV